MSGTRTTHDGPAPVGRPGSGSLTLPDVTGAVEPPLAFAMPAIAPLEDVAASDRSAGHPSAPSTASASELPEPAEPPRDYLRADRQLPLDAVVPRTGTQRDPQIPFSSAESVSQWGRRGCRDRSSAAHRDLLRTGRTGGVPVARVPLSGPGDLRELRPGELGAARLSADPPARHAHRGRAQSEPGVPLSPDG
ncbi:MAG: hypothetical protein LKI24_12215 [Acidipropionibacterium sp.]|jgi:hypothetical protein|nr:hypothetical protein [Acidipropionibacterium sp.]